MIERLEQFIDYLGLSVYAFEKKIGASNQTIARAIKNNSDIQAKWLTIILDNYPGLNTEWLLSGKGEMLKKTENGAKNETSVSEIESVDNESVIDKILNKNEKLIRENQDLRRENEDLKSNPGTVPGTNTYSYPEPKIRTVSESEASEK